MDEYRTDNLTDDEKRVLRAIAENGAVDEHCFPFNSIRRILNRDSGQDMEIPRIRHACRSLRGLGLLQYARGLVTEDGDFAGSGYGITAEGDAVFEALGAGVTSFYFARVDSLPNQDLNPSNLSR